ncbi:head-tail connector protein, partial [Escherichia coli]
MLLKMEEIKLQLRLDDDFSDEDELLELLGKAAQ